MTLTDDEILSKRGIISIKNSGSNKKIVEFERVFENVNKLYAEIKNIPFLRFLLQTISKEGEFMTFDELHQYVRCVVEKNINRKKYINRTLTDSPLKQIICKNCNDSIYRIECDKVDMVPDTIKCQNCKSPNYRDSFIIRDDWDIGVNELEYFLDKLCQIRVFHEGYQTYCTKCIEVKPLTPLGIDAIGKLKKQELIEYIEAFYCHRCKKLGTIQKVYAFNESLFQLWTSGNWLEWYVYRLLTASEIKFSYIKQGALIQKENKEEVEIDILLVSNSKVVSIECKDIKIVKTAKKDEVDQILKLIDFSDVIVFITTTEIESKTKRDLELVSKGYKKPISFIFIEGKDIESLPEFLLQKIEGLN